MVGAQTLSILAQREGPDSWIIIDRMGWPGEGFPPLLSPLLRSPRKWRRDLTERDRNTHSRMLGDSQGMRLGTFVCLFWPHRIPGSQQHPLLSGMEWGLNRDGARGRGLWWRTWRSLADRLVTLPQLRRPARALIPALALTRLLRFPEPERTGQRSAPLFYPSWHRAGGARRAPGTPEVLLLVLCLGQGGRCLRVGATWP